MIVQRLFLSVFVMGALASASGLTARQQPAARAGLETIQIRRTVYVIFGTGSNMLEPDGAAKWDPTPCDARF